MSCTGPGTKNSTINKAKGPDFIELVWQEIEIIINKCTINI